MTWSRRQALQRSNLHISEDAGRKKAERGRLRSTYVVKRCRVVVVGRIDHCSIFKKMLRNISVAEVCSHMQRL